MYIKANSICTISQLCGYTDRTPILKDQSNFRRKLAFAYCGINIYHVMTQRELLFHVRITLN